MKDMVFLSQDWLWLKDENVFINLKNYFPFDFLFVVLTHSCAINEIRENLSKPEI